MHSTLEVDSVTKSFGDRPVLTDIYLRCETGDIIGLLGRNGSGKSTLLKIVFGTIKSDHKFIKLMRLFIPRHTNSPMLSAICPRIVSCYHT